MKQSGKYILSKEIPRKRTQKKSYAILSEFSQLSNTERECRICVCFWQEELAGSRLGAEEEEDWLLLHAAAMATS